jgi:hypothetical protein
MAALPRKGGKTFFPAKADDDDEDIMAAPLRKGGKTFFPAEAGDVDEDVMAAPPRKGDKTFFPAKVVVEDNFPDRESISQGYQASDDVDKAPQQHSGPFPFGTPRISKSDPRADFSPPYEQISTRKVQQNDVALYTLPGNPAGN